MKDPKLQAEDIAWEVTYDDYTPKPLNLEVVKQHMDLMMKWLKPQKHHRILDVGAGKGYLASLLSSRSSYVCGVEIDFEYIKYAKKKHSHSNVEYILADALHLPFRKNSFDIIICREVIEHVTLPERLLEEIRRVMRKKAIFSTPNANTFSRMILRKLGKKIKTPPGHLREYTFDEFKRLLEKKGFKIIKMAGCYFPLPILFGYEKVANNNLLSRVYVSLCFILAKLFPRFSNYLTVVVELSSKKR